MRRCGRPRGLRTRTLTLDLTLALIITLAQTPILTGASHAEMWEAKRIKDAAIHPVTGEKMFLPGRMSAFVPMNTIPTAGMLLAGSPAAIVFWQVTGQRG